MIEQKQQLTIVDQVRKMEPEFKLALPQHITSEKFTRIALTAINSNPSLLGGDVDKKSVMAACMKAAQDGLVIDGREAALVIFNKKEGNGYVKAAQYMPMIAGVMKKMRNSGEISNISTGLVYKKEWEQGKFEYIKGDVESLKHEPILFEEKGDMIGCYAVVTLKDGSKVREFMDMNQINKVRNVSRSKDKGPWVDWFEEMATKSVLHKVSKLCPQSSDLDGLFKDLDSDESIDQETGEVTPAPVKRTGTRAAAAVKAAVSEEPEHIDAVFEEIDEEELPV